MTGVFVSSDSINCWATHESSKQLNFDFNCFWFDAKAFKLYYRGSTMPYWMVIWDFETLKVFTETQNMPLVERLAWWMYLYKFNKFWSFKAGKIAEIMGFTPWI